jgi:hypothetical protein
METIDINFDECLTRNNFLNVTDPYLNIKATLCLRLLLFLDSLHDFGDKTRTEAAKTDTAVKEQIMKELLIKLLKDLKWILSAPTDSPYLLMLKEFITNMFNETTEQLNENLKIYSIFFGSGNWPGMDRPSYNDIHQMMKEAAATGKAVVADNKYFSLIKETSRAAARLYFYPKYIGLKSFNEYPDTPEGESHYEHNINFGIRCLFLSTAPTGSGVGGQKLHQNKGNSKKLHSYANQLMNYIYQDPNDENEKYIIFIIACLIYFWEPVTNEEGSPHTYIQYNNIELGSYVHDLFFQYIINYSLNCFTIIPTSNHNITAGAWQFMTSILQYLCFQIETNQVCMGKQEALHKRSIAKGSNYNINTFFDQKVSVIIDAAGKPRSINYLTQCFIDIFKEPSVTNKQAFVLYNTSASKFDSAGISNLEASMKQVDKELEIGLVNETEYTKNYVFNIKCGGKLIISIGFIYDATSGKFLVVFKKFFSDTFSNTFNDLSGYQVSQDYSSLTKSIERFGVGQGDTKNNIYFLIAKSMGDFGQILFYYLLQERSGYFKGQRTSLTIFHTLDTWAASICSLFAAGVICEETSDAIKNDEENRLPYKRGNNKMFVSKYLRNQLLYIMTPSVYLPSINALVHGDIDIWSMLPLTLGQAQQCAKRENILKEDAIKLNEQISLLTQEILNLKERLTNADQLTLIAYQTFKDIITRNTADAQTIAGANAYVQEYEHNYREQLQAEQEVQVALEEKAEDVKKLIAPPNTSGQESIPYYMDPTATTTATPTGPTQMGGGVMTRSMAKRQQELNNKIINSFEVLEAQVPAAINYITNASQWFLSHGIQLPPQYLTAAQNFINNPDNYEPVAARTRSKLLALNQTSNVAAAHREVLTSRGLHGEERQQQRKNESVRYIDMKEEGQDNRKLATSSARTTKKSNQLAKLRGFGGRRNKHRGKLTVKAKKKLKKSKPRKYYKTRKIFKSKKEENIEKILKNLKI